MSKENSMTAHELARELLARADGPVTVSIYNPDGAPIFGTVDAVTDDEGTVFVSVLNTDG
jgi:hypothetical protein